MPPFASTVYALGVTEGFQIELLGADGAVSRHPLSPRPLNFGRGAANEVILVDDAASARHLRVWSTPEGVRVEDLGSRNGTWVNGERLAGECALVAGDELRVGAAVRLRVVRVPAGEGAVPAVEDMDTGVRHPFRSDRLTIGAPAGADIPVPGAEEGCAVFVERDGAVWLGREDEVIPIRVGEVFVVAGRRFRLGILPAEHGVTRELVLPHELPPTRYPYSLEARLDGPTGSEARFHDPRSGKSLALVADNPSLMVYVLARQHLADRSAGAATADRGWVADGDLALGIWGRTEALRQASNLNVLIWRVRRELQGAGFDPWCLEKRKKHTRLRLEAVVLR